MLFKLEFYKPSMCSGGSVDVLVKLLKSRVISFFIGASAPKGELRKMLEPCGVLNRFSSTEEAQS